jgi:hypothetical protein
MGAIKPETKQNSMFKKGLKIPVEVVNRKRTDNTMTTGKKGQKEQTIFYKTQRESH